MSVQDVKTYDVRTAVHSAAQEARNFDLNAIVRGFQLTIVGAVRALHNPQLFKSDVYKQVRIAIGAGLAIKILVEIPIQVLKAMIWVLPVFVDVDQEWWNKTVVGGFAFFSKTILQLPYLLMTLLSFYLVGPNLDNLFMMSLDWVDQTYLIKHKADDTAALRGMYHRPLRDYPMHRTMDKDQQIRWHGGSAQRFIHRFLRRTALSLTAYALSFVPLIGGLILPVTSFLAFKDSVGPVPAGVVFTVGLLLPRKHLTAFLQIYYGSRSLMRELLRPYLKRVQFTDEQQRQFFREREGVFFGFGFGYYLILKVPVVGVLVYGIAEASTAYLITKVVDPPPPKEMRAVYAASQVQWKNKKDFLQLPLGLIDREIDKADTKKINSFTDSAISQKRFS